MTGTPADRAREKEPVLFDAERQKVLYERLDSVLAACDDIARDDLLTVLSTLNRWNTSKEAWDVVRRWKKNHEEV